ncbi:hypothetical protein JYQ62_31050 [Nostoc sp. UHCC 0702]|nr:hypothetical protein JYQ62_31050 [Nostoc sp. UHCC 0702]
MMTESKETNNFWKTLPGILTALTALITAIGGIFLATKTPPLPPTPTPTPEEQPDQKGKPDQNPVQIPIK